MRGARAEALRVIERPAMDAEPCSAWRRAG